MSEYGISFILIFSYKDKIVDSVVIYKNKVQKKLYLGIFYAVL